MVEVSFINPLSNEGRQIVKEYGDLNKLFDEVSVQKSKNPNTGYVSVVIENPEQVTSPNLDGLVTHMESIGVKVHFRREAAISSIVSFLTKK